MPRASAAGLSRDGTDRASWPHGSGQRSLAPGADLRDDGGGADHISWALLTSGHGCFLAVKPNQPKDDGEHGVPDVALPNAALPIARGQRVCLTKNPQSARPLVCGNECEADGTKQDKRGNQHRRIFSSPRTMPQVGPFDYSPKIQTETLPTAHYCLALLRVPCAASGPSVVFIRGHPAPTAWTDHNWLFWTRGLVGLTHETAAQCDLARQRPSAQLSDSTYFLQRLLRGI
jgi:hypothetical protein